MRRDIENLSANAARVLADAANTTGWVTGWVEGKDNGDNPFFTLHIGKKGGAYYTLTWHTRGTGTYRLFSKLYRPEPGANWVDAASIKFITAALHN